MKIPKILALVATLLGVGESLQAQTWVNGYERQNGTHVDGYYRSNPNSTTSDNWSTRGNVNPYTGETGTRTQTDDGIQHYDRSYSGYRSR